MKRKRGWFENVNEEEHSDFDEEPDERSDIEEEEDGDDDEEPIIKLVLQDFPESVSQKHASDLLHSMATSKNILFFDF